MHRVIKIMRYCDSCGESLGKLQEKERGIFCAECHNIIQKLLSEGFIYLGRGNVKEDWKRIQSSDT